MSGGGGSGSDGGGDMQVSGAEAAYSREPGISTAADTRTSTTSYSGGGRDGPPGGGDQGMYYASSPHTGTAPTGPQLGPDTSTVGIAAPTNVDAEDEYLAPDKEHFNQTQKEINTKIKEAKKDDRYDVSLTEEQSEQFQKDMNEYYGTEDKKYEEYGRAGKGTVNLTFDEHWQNAPILHPALKFSPSARFLYVIGKQAQEALTSDYGTYSYAGPGTDRGGLLGQVLDQATQGVTVSKGTGAQSSNAASNFINTGKTQPTGSVAGSWYQSLGGTKAFDLATEYAAAKSNVTKRLGTPSQYGWLAVNDSPFYNWLKTNSLDKGIL